MEGLEMCVKGTPPAFKRHYEPSKDYDLSKDVGDINKLLSQLSVSAKLLSVDDLGAILKQENFFLLAIRDASKNNAIVGMASIYFVRTPMGLSARIEDVVVDEAHRGRGLGRRLLKRLCNLARQRQADYIELTSSLN